MCGIAGYLAPPFHQSLSEQAITAITETLVHRGPDSSGVWLDAEAGIALGHRRLSIIDLSPEGHQPMLSASGRYVIVFNGEVYNFPVIRRELENTGTDVPAWRGHSDTEVMLAAIEQWGLRDAVMRFVGMFAFALWDRKERLLHLVRDRIGEKPLYYSRQGGVLLFGSELKALKAHPAFRGEIDRDSLALLLRHNYIPAPYSIYKGVFKLLPGTILTISDRTGQDAAPQPYWSARAIAEAGAADPFRGSDAEAVRRLDGLLREAIGQQMVADVPLGAFLSGGIDSSTVVALMQAQSGRPVRTFTVGFNEAGYNEADHAQAVARHLGTEHTELYITPSDALAVIPRLPALFDEPFSDSSQIPTYLVSHLTRQHVTVSLSGDAGDELFGGYPRYLFAAYLWQKIGCLPPGVRRAVAAGLVALPAEMVDHGFGWLMHLFGRYGHTSSPSSKFQRLSEVLTAQSSEELYRLIVSHWKEPSSIVLNSSEPLTALTDAGSRAALPDFIQRMMFLDLVSYLPDDILVKVDRSAMGVSLETRVPLLDHRVVEFAWRVPLHMKIRNGQGKWLLRQVLYQYVPRELMDRPKMGFGVPIDAWLRGPLRDWAEALLDERRLRTEGFFKVEPIRKKWHEHLSGKSNWQYYLWDVLMFQAWLDAQPNPQ